MADLREQLQQCFQGRVCLMGLGNVLYGDDGLGVRLAEWMKRGQQVCDAKAGVRTGKTEQGAEHGLQCLIAGTLPERFIGRVAGAGFDHLVFVDAVDFGGVPGSVVLLNSDQMNARYPQVCTHKVSLSLLAKWVEANGNTKAWLLGVQPASVKPSDSLSPVVQATLESLLELLMDFSPEVLA